MAVPRCEGRIRTDHSRQDATPEALVAVRDRANPWQMFFADIGAIAETRAALVLRIRTRPADAEALPD